MTDDRPDDAADRPADKTAATGPSKHIVATLHTSAATLPPSPPSARRIQRLREFTRRDPTWKQDD